MSDENIFNLPQPADREAPFQLLVLPRLDQIGEMLANLFEAERADNGEK